MPDLLYETKTGTRFIAGIDEAGRGCIAGPVVAAFVIIDMEQSIPLNLLEEVNDSKLLSPLKRERLYGQIINLFPFSIGISCHLEIDQINILEATKLAIFRALKATKVPIDHILIDGNMKFDLPNYESIISGDSKSFSIACGSIIAKVYRDHIMNRMCEMFPNYLFSKHKGYGTKQHMEQITKYGLSIHHRKTFCKKFLGKID